MRLHWKALLWFVFKVVSVFRSFRGIALLRRRLWWRWTLKTKHSCCPGEQLQTTTTSLWLSGTLTTPWSSYRNSREEKKKSEHLLPWCRKRQNSVLISNWHLVVVVVVVFFKGLCVVEVWQLVEEDWRGTGLKRRRDQCQSHQLTIWYTMEIPLQ